MMNNNIFYTFQSRGSNKIGKLVAIEIDKIKLKKLNRIYYIYNVKKNHRRGFHAHKNLDQLAWCPSGSIEITLDNGASKNTFRLDSPEKALYVGPGIWHEMKWLKTNSVLCVAASELYDEGDYIRDYKKFLEMVSKGYWDEKGQNSTI